MDFHVDQIDHVELTVPDRHAAAKWYRDVLGLVIVAEYEHWAMDPKGPLMITTPQGSTKLALFEGKPEGSEQRIGVHLVAFRVGWKSFATFVARLSALMLKDDSGRTVTPDSVADHDCAYSIYFCDPYGHCLEITTYDYKETTMELRRLRTAEPG